MKDICFSIEKFTYTDSNTELDLSFLPKLIKRRLNKLDRNTVFLLNKLYDTEIENIIFSSKFGEFERLDSLINQYLEFSEVSPNTFSSSVHNFPVGFFSIFKKITIPTSALSASNDSFSLGFLNAVLSKENKILYCYSEEDKGIALKINKEKREYRLIKKEAIEKNNDYDICFLNFIQKKLPEIEFPFYKIERII